jgi:hypothetical protein
MICPNCHAEYREGFYRCSDCDVDLVQVAAQSLVAPSKDESTENPEDPFCEFWRGEDARVKGELCGLLSEMNIPYRTVEWQDHLFNRFRFPVFRIAIPFSLFEKAEKAVQEAYSPDFETSEESGSNLRGLLGNNKCGDTPGEER